VLWLHINNSCKLSLLITLRNTERNKLPSTKPVSGDGNLFPSLLYLTQSDDKCHKKKERKNTISYVLR
jgi:hypothetical protein